MTDFLLVRHASAESGIADGLLTPHGRSEAEALARRLRERSFDAVWSSDLGRAVETTGVLLAGREAPEPALSPLLREVDPPPEWLLSGDPAGYATWEREAIVDLAEKLSTWLRTATESSFAEYGHQVVCGNDGAAPSVKTAGSAGVPPAAGREPADRGGRDVRAPAIGPADRGRAREASERSVTDCTPGTVLVVSHAGPLRVLICLLLGLPPEAHWSFHLDRASLSVVRRGSDMGTLLLLNDCCHLI